MRSVLINIQPKWVEKIVNGEKTIEVRKTRPKLETPFKCYIYCTKNRPYLYRLSDDNNFELYNKLQPQSDGFVKDYNAQNGKVIGEFVCDRIDEFYCAIVPYKKENNFGYEHFIDNGVYKVTGCIEGVVFERNDRYIDTMLKNKELKEMCLSAQELFDYIDIRKNFYGWHISDLKIYDKPKELSEFRKPSKELHNIIENEKGHIVFQDGYIDGALITRPPQSWCYVEEL